MIVFIFHSVGLDKSQWFSNYLSLSVEHFEKWFEYLAENKYKTEFIDTWYNTEDVDTNIRNDKKIILTFDDGYVDNWVYLYPLLSKYEIKATIFVNPEFIVESESVRLNLQDIWNGKIKYSELNDKGFLNWKEIIKMSESGLVDIQSHSMSHNWYFTSNNIIDIYTKDKYSKYYWLNWIITPNLKPYYLNKNYSNNIPEGYPIYENGRSLAIRRYIPSNDLINYLTDNYYQTNNNKKDITQLLLNQKYYGHIESDKEMIERYYYELGESKKILENKLNKKVDYLCWPGGGYNSTSINVSRDVGYKASTIASREREITINNNKNYKRIRRYSLGGNIIYKGKSINDPSPYALKNNFIEFEGSKIKKLMRYGKKIYYICFKK